MSIYDRLFESGYLDKFIVGVYKDGTPLRFGEVEVDSNFQDDEGCTNPDGPWVYFLGKGDGSELVEVNELTYMLYLFKKDPNSFKHNLLKNGTEAD